jgi:hypothetical protein
MLSHTGPDWIRLGEFLIRRRIDLDPRYRNRRIFVAERAPDRYRIVNAIELGRRDNYEPATIAALEAAYGLAPGAIDRALAGGELEVQPVTADVAGAAEAMAVRREAVRRPSPAAVAPGDLTPDDVLPPGFPRPPAEIAWRLPWLALAVQAEVRAAAEREGVPAADLSGAALFGDGTYEAWLWTTYEAVMPDIRWRVATIALTRAIAELGDPSAQSAS